MRRDKLVDYNEDVDYDDLEYHTHRDQPGHLWYVCPRCGGEYLAPFIVNEGGVDMCIDCAAKEGDWAD